MRAPAAVLAACFAAAAHAQQAPSTRELAGLSLEELATIEVTSVSRRPEPLGQAAASIYVITAEDIRRSGARRLPEVLRLAPNLHVAQVRSYQYAISARGFNNPTANKLLVLIDGRTVYTPLFSSVFWEQEEVPLEDIERIEVVSGPGASLWGLNAVNGVINVITKAAAATAGTIAVARVGEDEGGALLRHGGELGTRGDFRVYGRWFELAASERQTGVPQRDGWRQAQAGFRADWSLDWGELTVSGDAYRGRSDHRGFAGGREITPLESEGANLLARWSREFGDSFSASLQYYVDRTRRRDVVLFGPESTIHDLEAQVAGRIGAHRIVAGAGHRVGSDEVEAGLISRLIPASRSLAWTHVFVQDQYAVGDRIELTGGLRLERNDYTGWEYLPTARLSWRPLDTHMLWGAVSRAVRAPARLDRDVFFPANPPFLILGGPDFKSEVALVYEAGYRAHPTPALHYSITAFLHQWDRLRSGQGRGGALVNQIEGTASGLEAWATWQPMPGWRISAGAMRLNMKLRLEPDSTDAVGVRNANLANDPRWQWSIRSSHELPFGLELDVAFRAVGGLRNTPTPGYEALDARIAWRATQRLELSLVGRNLADSSHIEFGAPATASAFARSVYARLDYRF